MNKKRAILVCILPEVKGDTLRTFLLNVVLFAKQVDVDIHLLSSDAAANLNTPLAGIFGNALQAVTIVSHPIAEEWPPNAVGEAVKLYSCDLVVVPSWVPSGGISDEDGNGARVRKYLLEQTSDPIMLLPSKVDLGKTPIDPSLFR